LSKSAVEVDNTRRRSLSCGNGQETAHPRKPQVQAGLVVGEELGIVQGDGPPEKIQQRRFLEEPRHQGRKTGW
jgi:hypothetical protein